DDIEPPIPGREHHGIESDVRTDIEKRVARPQQLLDEQCRYGFVVSGPLPVELVTEIVSAGEFEAHPVRHADAEYTIRIPVIPRSKSKRTEQRFRNRQMVAE